MKKSTQFIPLLPEFNKFIRASRSGKRRKPDGLRLAMGTVNSYTHCIKLLERYTDKTGELWIYTGVALNKRLMRERIRYWKNTIYSLYDFLNHKGYSDSYIWGTMKIFRAFMRYLLAQRGLPDAGLPVFRFPALVMTDPITLSLDRVKELFLVNFPKTFCGTRLSFARDILCLNPQ